MPTYVRAVVSDDEKQEVKRRAAELGMKESELIREGLKMMGVEIEVEKEVGAPEGNVNNPRGNPELFKYSSKYKKSRREE